MRHRASKILAFTLAALASACAAPLRMPDGVYSDSAGGTLTVSGEYIDIQIPTTEPGVQTSGTHAVYRLRSDGGLRLSGSSNSSYFVFFVIDQDWRWTGSAIESRNRHDGTVVTYMPVR